MSKQDYAFPSENDDGKQYNWINKGMTLRDYFAAKAMQGLISGTYGRNTTLFTEELARESFRLADIMLKEREIER